ncbi:MAG: phytanoyl-CoA dioxygenase family protein [Verrucomicrobiota bacterium]
MITACSLEELQITDKSVPAVMDKLNEWGVLVLPDYTTEDELKALNEEFELILEKKEELEGVKDYAYDTGKAAIMTRDKLDTSLLPVTTRIFSDPFMKEIKEEYWGKHATFNNEIMVVNDVVGTKHAANDMHFDIVPTFKFFLYLTDTTVENGAFTCVPGAQIETKKIRDQHGRNVSYKNRHLSRDLPFEESDVVPIEGPRGSMIIFSTEVWHRAGQVSSGERRVMRGHSRRPEDERGLKNFFKKFISGK